MPYIHEWQNLIFRFLPEPHSNNSVKTTERAYAAFVRNERFKQTIALQDEPQKPKLKLVT